MSGSSIAVFSRVFDGIGRPCIRGGRSARAGFRVTGRLDVPSHAASWCNLRESRESSSFESPTLCRDIPCHGVTVSRCYGVEPRAHRGSASVSDHYVTGSLLLLGAPPCRRPTTRFRPGAKSPGSQAIALESRHAARATSEASSSTGDGMHVAHSLYPTARGRLTVRWSARRFVSPNPPMKWRNEPAGPVRPRAASS